MNNATYLSLFLQEMRDNCASLGQLLVSLEKNPTDGALLGEIMRLSHSCKGASATMGFEKTAELCHAMEDVFDAARNGSLRITSSSIDVCLLALDALEDALKCVEKEQKEPEGFEVLGRVKEMIVERKNGEDSEDSEDSEEQKEKSSESSVSSESSKSSSKNGQPTLSRPNDELREIDRDSVLPQIRVESKKLDALLDLAGELSILRLQFAAQCNDPALKALFSPLLARFSRLADELTYHVTQSRLIPLDQVFVRFPRLVRDLARTQKKSIAFTMEGTGIELDKTLVDHITTPLIHLLRNAVDHGIESPDERRKNGKPEEGAMSIRVRREQGFAIVTVEDDGAPIRIEDVKRIAKERGFADAEVAAIQSDNLLDFLCNARFSSSKKVSMVSGRGVGLSAVRQIVKELGGRLHLEQRDGRKRFVMSLPLQLSVIRAIMVTVQGSTFGLPFVHISRLLHVTSADIRSSLGQEAVIVDGQDVPLLRLSHVFNARSAGVADVAERTEGTGEKNTSVTSATSVASVPSETSLQLLLTDGVFGRIALCVDDVLGNEEITVKPVSEAVKNVQYFSGYTVLGDGGVALIVDVPTLIQHQKAQAVSAVST